MRIANTGAADSDYGEGLAMVRGTSLQDGTIEAILSGETAPVAPAELRGFVLRRVERLAVVPTDHTMNEIDGHGSGDERVPF